jgi:nicotinamidase-related amidase
MTTTYDPKITALLCIDFYNDFLSEGGKLWPWVKDIAEEVNLLDNLRTIVRTARAARIKVYHVPHHRWEPGDYVDWKYPSPYQLGAAERQAFAKDTWGGTFHDDFHVQPDDIVATEHWASSGFPNTDLEHKLKRYGKEKIICVGLLANTCLEATARIGMELGFHVTLVRDGTAARSHEALHATLNIDGPTFAHEILTTAELVSAIKRSASADKSAA